MNRLLTTIKGLYNRIIVLKMSVSNICFKMDTAFLTLANMHSPKASIYYIYIDR